MGRAWTANFPTRYLPMVQPRQNRLVSGHHNKTASGFLLIRFGRSVHRSNLDLRRARTVQPPFITSIA